MKPYMISHMMTSVDGRIDCPMIGLLSTDEYYVALGGSASARNCREE